MLEIGNLHAAGKWNFDMYENIIFKLAKIEIDLFSICMHFRAGQF